MDGQRIYRGEKHGRNLPGEQWEQNMGIYNNHGMSLLQLSLHRERGGKQHLSSLLLFYRAQYKSIEDSSFGKGQLLSGRRVGSAGNGEKGCTLDSYDTCLPVIHDTVCRSFWGITEPRRQNC